ncbi:hypothetical protein [Paracoccus tibetensis]|uniref:Uncharacterized protein n=1 Tax=Paracoccus tibetensis TaxID=336292 RepID=A0A1G5BCY1_9RHOB|nr:hypothetical protein [Paracoccus tibetensis]SCX87989.1 hypothetical protein SAMN05660710_00093 [Paracoccus tibetensis]
MRSEGEGVSLNSIEALNGQIQALEVIMMQMIRIIAEGKQGEDAFATLARSLRAEATAIAMMPGDLGRAARARLDMFAGFCEAPSRGV